jgi:ABC-2 type transport system ATP-binding protein
VTSPSSPGRVRTALGRPVVRRRLLSTAVVLVLLAAGLTWLTWDSTEPYRTTDSMVTVQSGGGPVRLDTRLYVPESATASNPAPAVLLAHGFGGSKESVATSAGELAGQGYVVLTWSARGFGRSGGQISLNDPDHEVTDARRLLDRLGALPEVRKDADGDPRVGVVGGSYGGGLTLLLAAYDHRVDAIVPQVTWNDLSRSFFPDSDGGPATGGVFKKAWAGLFFGSGSALDPALLGGSGGAADSGSTAGSGGSGGSGGTSGSAPGGGSAGGAAAPGDAAVPGLPGAADPQCGRFAADVCRMYLGVGATGRATPDAVALLQRRSPQSVIDRIQAPTLLVQGQADSLFPLAEADANARGIAANGTPVRVAWYSGGHDGEGSQADQDRVKFLTVQWLDHYVKGDGSAPAESFTYSNSGGLNVSTGRVTSTGFSAPSYPGLDGAGSPRRVALAGPPQTVAVPPGGAPAAVSTLPGLGGLGQLAGGVSLDIPGQVASFVSEPLGDALDIVGTPTVRLRVASRTGEAVVFVKLYSVGPGGRPTLPQGLVAPVRLTGLRPTLAGAAPVEITLPAIAYRVEAGHRLQLAVSTTDQAYALPTEPGTYQVALAGDVALPTVDGAPLAATGSLWTRVLLGLVAVLAVGLAAGVLIARVRRRRLASTVDPQHADTPIVIRDLSKAYSDGFVAVRNLSFSVERGQVLGLLGPNGAGKTTTLRMLMGLIRPSGGDILVFGHRVRAGAPVLSRLGSFVEGTGFLPHLSGMDNLRLYWRATGRPFADAHLEEALEIAGLGSAVHRKVKTYSQGMRQRLAIAQAMLGLPDLLVLDEPTNGLDPPQIAEMRQVLRRYATGGRTVLVSSHLLAEVEQTCTHVVVMHQGALVAAGTVADVTGESASVLVGVDDVEAALRVLDGARGVAAAHGGEGGVVVEFDPSLNGTGRIEVVRQLVEGGVGVDRVAPRRRLEDVFLTLVGGDGK